MAIPSLLIASLIVFSLPRLLPGDVVQLMLEEKAYGKDLEDLRAKLGLNRPMYIQYVEWLGQVPRGDLGESLWTKRPGAGGAGPAPAREPRAGRARPVLRHRHRRAHRRAGRDPPGHRSPTTSCAAWPSSGSRCPGFWIATLVVLLPAIWWGWSPPIQFTEFSEDPWAHIAQFLLPAFILGIASAAAIMRLTRGTLLEVLRQDYVRTAWAKGLRERVVVLKHSLKNALIPVVTVLGIQVAQILGGTVIFEQHLRPARHGPLPLRRHQPARLPGDPGREPAHRHRWWSR